VPTPTAINKAWVLRTIADEAAIDPRKQYDAYDE
jgi:hypothetical protein